MFKKVETEWELTMFNSIWTTVWKEKGYELEYAEQALERYVAISPEGQYVGTSEIKAYTPGVSIIDSVAPFHNHPKIAADPAQVAEIDKIAVIKQYRGHPITDLLSSAVFSAETHQFRYFISLLEPVFYRALRITFHVPMEKAGEKTFYKGDYVIPVIFDMERMYSNKEQYEWLAYPDSHRIGSGITTT
ncbi:hypothetical protein [Paenibacillus radicis (ex Gao et al. 2016)]|uniref:Uncharacterized protein n=1 Tax=Paenibacillus radicis (ex Gao et al. 2016) TaxID=1737354 RepID=A0A917HMM3_9BACL|nr:hypothetical protein [Paenibacillus radicis (ex Gao et al. 2016)]GGG83713.1 hypothetical protein GCM10010918_46780 [Paenibacillus radicis (ex Gao et al. 2016)]